MIVLAVAFVSLLRHSVLSHLLLALVVVVVVVVVVSVADIHFLWIEYSTENDGEVDDNDDEERRLQ